MKKSANNRIVIQSGQPGGTSAAIAAMMQHDHAVCVTADGLRLTYDRTGDRAVFAVTRLCYSEKDFPNIHETRIIAARAYPHMVLTDQPTYYTEELKNSAGQTYAYKGVAWTLKVEEVKL